MDSQLAYTVAFGYVQGIGTVRYTQLVDYFGSPAAAWNASEKELFRTGLPAKTLENLIAFRNCTDVQQLVEQIRAKGIRITAKDDADYPSLLRHIENPPEVLYYAGKLPDPDAKAVSIVGTRRMTMYGQQMARELAAFLASYGIVVVSGLARGIDGVAHQATIDVGGTTVAVLGSGVDIIYPPEHRGLAVSICKNGAVLSAYAPGTQPDRGNFPPRNRIISGMTSACIVIEAGERSGSLITARFAAEQGREVFVIPGNFNAPQSRGTNRLIRDGARPLYEKNELIEFLQNSQSEMPVALSKPSQMTFENEEERHVLALIANEPLHIDEIARLSAIPLSKLSSMLLMMELKGFVQETSAQTYQKNNALY